LTLLQLLDFQKQHKIFSYFDTIFGRFCEKFTNIMYYFANFLLLSPNRNGKTTFLQWSLNL